MTKTLIRAGWLIDGTGAPPVQNGFVLVSGDRIIATGASSDTSEPEGATVIDLPNHTLLPGLIDVHSHVSIHTLGHEKAQVARREAAIVIDALSWLREDLDAGVTTMRTLGDPDFLDIHLRQAQREGRIEAPRLQVAGNLVQSSHVSVSVSKSTCNGSDAIREAIRESIRAGCDWVKFYSTPASRTPNPILPIFSRGEVEVVFEEARRAGRPVSAHCHGGDAADWCIELGVNSLEHGLFLERRQMAEMARRGITLVPTVGVILLQETSPRPPELVRAQDKAASYLATAREEGVRCVPGTDAVHGRLSFEVEALTKAGWPTVDAIAAVTGHAAVLLGLSEHVGTLKAGVLADVVAVDGDVGSDLSKLSAVDLVMQDGILRRDRISSGNWRKAA